MSGFPFFSVTFVAVAIHVVTAIAATLTETVSNPKGWTQGLNSINGTVRLFTVRRRDVRFLASWAFILIARAAIAIAAISFLLALMTGGGWG